MRLKKNIAGRYTIMCLGRVVIEDLGEKYL